MFTCVTFAAMAAASRHGMMDALNRRYLMNRMAFICGAGWSDMIIGFNGFYLRLKNKTDNRQLYDYPLLYRIGHPAATT